MNQQADHVDNLHYEQVGEKYEGYTIECAASKSKSEPSKWMGHFRAYKDDLPTLRASIANLQVNEGLAREKAAEIARAKIDEAVAGQK